MIEKLKYWIADLVNPFYPLLRKMPTAIQRFRYWKKYRRKLNLNNPVLFYDKTIWMSLKTDTLLWTELADKYAVRKYVQEKIGNEILNDLYDVYNSVTEIDYEKLPTSFVLKTTNGCATNIIVSDKNNLNIEKANKQLTKWQNFHYGEIIGQLHYSKIKPRIIAEKMLIQDTSKNIPLIDYKIYCFSGKPIYILVTSDRIIETHTYARMMYDIEWNPYPEFFIDDVLLKEVKKPESLDVMLDSAEKLSQSIPFVRVDLYEINKKPIFGEMTFMPGMEAGFTTEFQKKLGDLITIV